MTVILFIFLMNFRASFISFISMPVSLLAGVMVLKWFGVSLNSMTIGGLAIAIGEVVDDAIIGDDVVLYANVTIGHHCQIGHRVIIHSGAVIGSDGFGYATDGNGHHLKRPQVGMVQIDDDVEIGANTCIDRATFGKTWIKRGTKIDNLVQLAHNVVIGEDALLVAQVGMAGSTTTGNGVVLGGQVGLSGHIHLGDRVMVAAKSGVHDNQPSGAVVAGIPAIPHKTWLRSSAAYAKLPEMVRELRELRRKVAELSQAMTPGQDESLGNNE